MNWITTLGGATRVPAASTCGVSRWLRAQPVPTQPRRLELPLEPGLSDVRVLPADVSTVSIEEDAGTDRLSLRVFGNAERGQARLVATLDNLGKGAAGAAVQNLNIMAGLDPTAGLVL